MRLALPRESLEIGDQRALRILVAHAFYRLDGGENRYVRQQVELLSRSHTVQLAGEHNEALPGGLQAWARMTYSRQKKREFAELLDRFRPDVVHLHNSYPSTGPTVPLACEEAHIPLVHTVHNYRLRCPNAYMFTEGAICRRCEKGVYASALMHKCFPEVRQSAAYASALWVHRFVMKLEDKIALFVAPSRFMRDRLVHWDIPLERTTIVPNYVDPPSQKRTGTGDFGVYVGRISPEKGLDVLIRALVLAGDPPFKIVGDGPVYAEVRRLAADSGLRRTEFLGHLPSETVMDVVNDCRYLAMPSMGEEVFPLAPLEAMAHGKPIVVSAIGGLPELVGDGGGLTFQPGNADKFARQIQKLNEDDDYCRAAGEAGLESWRAKYSPEVHLALLLQAYEMCIELHQGN